MPAEEAEGEDDALGEQRVGGAQQVHRLDEAGDADDGVAAGRGADLGEHARELDRVVAGLGAGAELRLGAGHTVGEAGVVRRPDRRRDVRDGVDEPVSQELGGDPADHAAGAAAVAEAGLGDVADVGRLEAAEPSVAVRARRGSAPRRSQSRRRRPGRKGRCGRAPPRDGRATPGGPLGLRWSP